MRLFLHIYLRHQILLSIVVFQKCRHSMSYNPLGEVNVPENSTDEHLKGILERLTNAGKDERIGCKKCGIRKFHSKTHSSIPEDTCRLVLSRTSVP